MRVFISLVLAASCAGLLAGSAPAIRDISWADSQHGWMAGCGLEDPCVVSTENGGRTWHRIGSFEVAGLVRTSRNAGVVTETGKTVGGRGRESLNWWTRDNGRHWYNATVGLIQGEYVGSGPFLYSLGRRALYQVRPWPPRGRAPRRCRFDCLWDGGAHRVAVARLRNGRFAGVANLPGGALAVIDSDDEAKPSRVLLRRAGRNRWVTLPSVTAVRPCNFFGAEPSVDWPKIVVYGCTGPNRAVTWISEDGGRNWLVYRR